VSEIRTLPLEFDELFRREYPRMLHASFLIVGNREDPATSCRRHLPG